MSFETSRSLRRLKTRANRLKKTKQQKTKRVARRFCLICAALLVCILGDSRPRPIGAQRANRANKEFMEQMRAKKIKYTHAQNKISSRRR